MDHACKALAEQKSKKATLYFKTRLSALGQRWPFSIPKVVAKSAGFE
jgi:hypothetical protein